MPTSGSFVGDGGSVGRFREKPTARHGFALTERAGSSASYAPDLGFASAAKVAASLSAGVALQEGSVETKTVEFDVACFDDGGSEARSASAQLFQTVGKKRYGSSTTPATLASVLT